MNFSVDFCENPKRFSAQFHEDDQAFDAFGKGVVLVNGKDGVSPTVTVTDIDGGHRVTITDKDGEKTFDVMDGRDGEGGAGGSSVQSDWNVNDEADPAYVKNRTHWMERPFEPIVWDGSTEGRDSIDVSAISGYPAGSLVFHKVSGQVLSPEMLTEANYYAVINGETNEGNSVQDFTVTDVVAGSVFVVAYKLKRRIETGLEDWAAGMVLVTSISGDFSDTLGLVIPSVGIYAMQQYGAPYDLKITGDIYHKLSAEFLPDTFASVDYVNELITGAIGGSY